LTEVISIAVAAGFNSEKDLASERPEYLFRGLRNYREALKANDFGILKTCL
jgi:hypothetical protein